MSDPGEPKRRATYRDVLDAPPNRVAEIVSGELRLSPRPGAPHTAVAAGLAYELGPPFGRLSSSTEKLDRVEKMPVYATAGVTYAWLVSPTRHTLEAHRLIDGRWSVIGVHRDTDRVRIEPFEAIELDLAMLWIDSPLPTRAQEQPEHDDHQAPHG